MQIIESQPAIQGHLAIIQCAGSNGSRKGQWVNLRLVSFTAEAWARFEKGEIGRLVGTDYITQIDSFEVDARNQGPRSAYGKALAELRSNPCWKRLGLRQALHDAAATSQEATARARI